MHRPLSSHLHAAVVLAAVIGLPLLGAVVAGREPREYFRFPPPLEIPTDYLRFSWWAAGAVIGLVALIAAPWAPRRRRVDTLPASSSASDTSPRRGFPLWGWPALAWTLLWWHLAWTRWAWFEPLQLYTFFPLWFGFIVTVNAAIEARKGTCLMRRSPGGWLALFVVSAGVWWVFEWLNRFVHNWHYLAVEGFGPWPYFFHATLCFSTVLPAVAAVAEWLATHRGWMKRLAAGPRWKWIAHPGAAAALFAFGSLALIGTGMFPRWFYPALWVAPLALLLAAPGRGKDGITRELARGDWSRAGTWMIAALVCGFFWEMWNWRSLAKWIYTVPGVERWRVFEMPLLGYAGYLPFGLECLLVAERVLRPRADHALIEREAGKP